MTLPLGTRLGPHRIDALLARGGMGEVYLALDAVRQAEELDPTYFFPHWSYGWIAIQAGRPAEAIPHFERAKTMGASAFVSAWLAYACGATGDAARAEREVEDLAAMSLRGEITAFDRALVALGRGDHALALSCLEQAYVADSQWLGWLSHDRVFDPVRAEPRFVALLEKVNLAR